MTEEKSKRESLQKRNTASSRSDRADFMELSPQRVATLLVIAIVLLAINSILLAAVWLESAAEPAFLTIDSEEQIVLDIEDVVNNSVTYGVWVSLKNTGGKVAYASASGEVLVSLYGSAYGEEVQEVLDYVSLSIAPGESSWLSFGSFTTSPGWHYVVRVHISWNGGSLQLSRVVS
ncbi:MAG: hypothetical protein LN415_07780 [Candidatus Thermoplasmatota archaeon]|nr:hypothetical protein [Candidatus Thermoplasmatota archaeon]